MTLIDDSFWTLRIDPTRPTPLGPEEPEDFIHELSGKILLSPDEMSDGREDEKEGKTDSRSYGWHDPEIRIPLPSESKYQIRRNENQN